MWVSLIMGLIIILIGYFFDYKSNKESFLSDLRGGIFIVSIFGSYALILKLFFDVGILYIIFSIGLEIILLFAIKALIDSNR